MKKLILIHIESFFKSVRFVLKEITEINLKKRNLFLTILQIISLVIICTFALAIGSCIALISLIFLFVIGICIYPIYSGLKKIDKLRNKGMVLS